MKQEIVLPKNIRQIGEIQQDKKVYLEDYVMTYIRKKEHEGEGYAGLLFGKKEQDEQGSYFFLKGALLLDQTLEARQRWEKVEEERKTYFPDMEMWGYFLIGTMEEEGLEEITERLYGTSAIIFHLQEGEEMVYWSEEKQYHRLKGYFVFYERNPQMQKYMAEAEAPKRVEEEGVSDKAIVSFREKVKEKRKGRRQGGVRYLASSFLILTILLLGVTIINNYDRMKNMEKLIAEISAEQQLAAQVLSMEVETEEVEETQMVEKTEEPDEQEVMAEAAVETELSGTESEDDLAEETEELREVMAQISAAEQGLAERNYSAEDVAQIDAQILGKADEVLASIQRQSKAVYTIRYGDTLADISEMYYGNLGKIQEICEINGIEDANMIVPGQKIVLP